MPIMWKIIIVDNKRWGGNTPTLNWRIFMPLFGILKSSVEENTGADNELAAVFSTPLTISSNQPVLAADTISLRRLTSGQRAQRWEITANICPTVGSNEYLIHSILYGHEHTFNVRMPQTPKTPYSEDILTVSGDAGKGDTVLLYAPATTGDLIVGEFIRLGDAPKVYLVTSVDAENDEIIIFPPLLENIADSTPIHHGSKVTLRAKLDTTSIIGMTFIDGLLMDPGAITLIEDVTLSGWPL